MSVGAALMLAALVASAAPPAALLPQVLRQPAAMTPRALNVGMLAVTRAGNRLVSVGERGTVLWSDDEGKQWTQARVPVQVTLTGVRFVNERVGWAVGHLGVVLRTDDAGQTWALQMDGARAAALAVEEAQASGDQAAIGRAQQLVDDGPDKPFFDLMFKDDQHGWVVGAYNTVLRTDDGGRTWRSVQMRVPNPAGTHLYAVIADGNGLMLAGEQGFLARSVDGGDSFTALPAPYKGSFFGLLRGNDGALTAYGLRGNVWRTTDAERRVWQKLDSGVTTSVSGGQLLPDGGVVLLTQTGDLLLSRDGATFTRQAASPQMPAVGLVVLPSGGVMVASLRGLQRVSLP